MSTPSKENLMLGKGKVFFDRFVNGVPTGKRHLGNCTALNLTTTTEKKEKYSSMQAETVLYASVVTQVNATAKVTLDEYDRDNLALVLLGENAIINQTAQVGLTKTIEDAVPGHFYELGHYDVSNVVIGGGTPAPAAIGAVVPNVSNTSDGTVTTSGTYTGTTADTIFVKITSANTTPGAIAGTKFQWKKGAAGVYSADITAGGTASLLGEGVSLKLELTGTQNFVAGDTYTFTVTPATTGSYVLDADYKVFDAAAGLIQILEKGSIPAGTDLTVTFDTAASKRVATSGASDVNIEGELYFLGDPTMGPAKILNIWRGKVTPDGDVGLITDDFGSFGLTVDAQDDRENHPDYPLYKLADKNASV